LAYRGLDFLVYAASVTKSTKFFAIADVMEKALRYTPPPPLSPTVNQLALDLTDRSHIIRCKKDELRYDAIAGLIRLFVKKFTQKRHTHTLHLFDLMLKLAKERHQTLRAKVIVFLLSFRASSRYLMQLSVHRYVKPEQQEGDKETASTASDVSSRKSGAEPDRKSLSSPRQKENKPGPSSAKDASKYASDLLWRLALLANTSLTITLMFGWSADRQTLFRSS
jgi:hypothetical protein